MECHNQIHEVPGLKLIINYALCYPPSKKMNTCVLAASAILAGGSFPYVFFSALHPMFVHPRFAAVPSEARREHQVL